VSGACVRACVSEVSEGRPVVGLHCWVENPACITRLKIRPELLSNIRPELLGKTRSALLGRIPGPVFL
jgi:hypothetical protein